MLALVAIHAPEGKRATWFALMTSFMNIALVAGGLSTKYLNKIFIVSRGEYTELGHLLVITTIIGFIIPVIAIIVFGKRAEK